MPKQFATLSDHNRLANARGYLQATVEELSRVNVFEKTIVEAASAITILHSILGELEVSSLAARIQDPQNRRAKRLPSIAQKCVGELTTERERITAEM